MIGGLVGFWGCRPWLGLKTFNYGQMAVLLLSWKIASLLCLPSAGWARLTRLRLLAYLVWPGMQPQQFFEGQKPPAGGSITDRFRVPHQRADGCGTGLASASHPAGGNPSDGSFLDRPGGRLHPVPRREAPLLAR